MSARPVLNLTLAAALAVSLWLNWYSRRPAVLPNIELAQTMARDAAYGTFDPNPHFPDAATARHPVSQTIARGMTPLGFGPSAMEAIRAGNELVNPFSADDGHALERGRIVYSRYCELCHAADGGGAGPLTRHGFPAPTLHRTSAREMKDGQLFHLVTFGRGAMPAHGSQIPASDRWKVVLHVRLLQQQGASSDTPAAGS